MSIMKRLMGFATAAQLAFSAQLTDPTSKDNSPDCDCYLASGPDPGYFQYHRFWDFRDVSSDGSNDFTSAPLLVSANQDIGGEPATSSYFTSSQWQQDWAIQGYIKSNSSSDSPIKSVNSLQNVFISRNSSAPSNSSTFLTLRTNRLSDFMSVAEIDSKQNNLLHASIRTRMRVIPNGLGNSSAPTAGESKVDNADTGSSSAHPVDGGAVAGVFTYFNDTQESDIEILTTEPTNFIHYTNQPDYDKDADTSIPGASSNASLPNSLAYTDWIEHRLDWYDGVVRWFVNDELVLNKTQNAPSVPSTLILNLWGDGGSWSGNMTPGGEVNVGIQWIEMAFNVSGDLADSSSSSSSSSRKRALPAVQLDTRDDGDGKCNTACKLDGVAKVGFPEKGYYESTPTSSSGGSSSSSSSSSSSPSAISSGAASGTSSSKSSGPSFIRGAETRTFAMYTLPLVLVFALLSV